MPPRPIPKWAQTLGHVPAFDGEEGCAFALQDPATGICYGYDIDGPCRCFGTGSGDTFIKAALDHLHPIATADPAHISLALDIMRVLGLTHAPEGAAIRLPETP